MTHSTLKHRIRSLVDLGCAAAGALQWHERRMRSGLTVLMYHRILPRADCAAYPLESLVMPLDAFSAQVGWLARHCTVLPVALALERLASEETPEKPLVAVTFDDGYADNAEHAAPVLEAHGLRGTFFTATGFIDKGGPFWFDLAADAWTRLDSVRKRGLLSHLRESIGETAASSGTSIELSAWMGLLKRLPVETRDRWVGAAQDVAEGVFPANKYRAMTREQVLQLDRRGHEVASHGVSHPILPLLDEAALERELVESRAVLSDWLEHEVVGFCYPNGDADPRVIAAVRSAGYRYACSTVEGLNARDEDRFRLKRRPIAMRRVFGPGDAHSMLGFRAEISGLRERLR